MSGRECKNRVNGHNPAEITADDRSKDVALLQGLIEGIYRERTSNASYGTSTITLKFLDGRLTMVDVVNQSSHKPPSVIAREGR